MRAPTRAMTNYVVDAVIAAAFVVSAVSGVIFLLPSGWVSTASGAPSMVWVTLATWRTLHEWSSLIMIGGVVLHTILHWRWVVAMTKKTFARPRTASAEASRAAAGAAPVAPAPVAAVADRGSTVVVTRYTRDARRPWSRRRSEAPSAAAAGACDETHEQDAPRRTRREVLVGLGLVGAAVATGGIAGRVIADQVLQHTASADDATAGGEATWESSSGSSTAGEASSTDSGSSAGTSTGDGSSSSSSSSSSSNTLVADRVVVDEGRCSGCGHCLPACPYGVFAWSGSVAVVADADACRLCGRCLQACPEAAITLNA